MVKLELIKILHKHILTSILTSYSPYTNQLNILLDILLPLAVNSIHASRGKWRVLTGIWHPNVRRVSRLPSGRESVSGCENCHFVTQIDAR